MNPGGLGTHALYDFIYGSNHTVLLDSTQFLKTATETIGTSIINVTEHPIGEGYSFVVIFMDGYFSVRTWPDMGVALVDVFRNGDSGAFDIIDIFISKLENKPNKTFQSKLFRGFHNY